MAVISSQIVKDNRSLELFRIDPHLQITVLMSRSSITTCDMTVIPDSDIFIGICLVTNKALISLLKMLLIPVLNLVAMIFWQYWASFSISSINFLIGFSPL